MFCEENFVYLIPLCIVSGLGMVVGGIGGGMGRESVFCNTGCLLPGSIRRVEAVSLCMVEVFFLAFLPRLSCGSAEEIMQLSINPQSIKAQNECFIFQCFYWVKNDAYILGACFVAVSIAGSTGGTATVSVVEGAGLVTDVSAGIVAIESALSVPACSSS
jgi:hypothetical protein